MDANRTDVLPSDARQSIGEPRVLISRSALLHNARVLRRRLKPGTKLCAVVKADGYGHGARMVADTLGNVSDDDQPPPADALAVASLDEAAALAFSAELQGTPLPLLVMRPLENAFVGRQRGKIEHAIRFGWSLSICTASAADDLARIAIASGRRAAVQVMVDTGMTRSGVAPEQLGALLQKIESHPSLRLTGICTHFASSEDATDPFTAEQLRRFRAATDASVPSNNGSCGASIPTSAPIAATPVSERTREDPDLSRDGGENPSLRPGSETGAGHSAAPNGPISPKLSCAARALRHAASSAAVFFAPESHLDMVRPGIALYGIDPTGRPHLDRPLKPVLKWTAPLIGISEIPAGTSVGYGRTWTAIRRTRVGLIPVGYADGYPRSFSNRALVLIHGRPAPVIGRISMDLTTIDLTEIPHPAIGDEITLLEDDPLSHVSAYALARWAETIPYEIFCGIGPRVARVAVGGVDDLTMQNDAV